MITESNFIDSELSTFNASAVNIIYNNEFNRNILIDNTPLLMIINENDDDNNHHHDQCCIDDDLDGRYEFQIDDEEEEELEPEQTQETFDCQ